MRDVFELCRKAPRSCDCFSEWIWSKILQVISFSWWGVAFFIIIHWLLLIFFIQTKLKCWSNYSFAQIWFVLEESGRIRRRFGRNVGILKRLKNYRRFKRIFDCYSFNSILEYRKIGKILLNCIWFLQNMILNKAIRSNSYKIRQFYFVFKEFCCLWVLSPRIWNVLWMRFSKINLLRRSKKWSDNPDTKKVIFLIYFWVENMLSPNIWDWNPILNTWYLRMPLVSVVSRRFSKNLWEELLVRMRLNYLFLWYFLIFTTKVLGSLFSIKSFT